MKKAFILALIFAGGAFGQSGVFNLPFKPQPRILIPHIEAEKYTGTTTSVFVVRTTNYVPVMGVVTQIVGGVTSSVSVVRSVSVVTNFLSITNTSAVDNPYRSLKFCDFVLKCVSQNANLYAFTKTGARTPLLYVYSSTDGIDQPFADTNAVVFYQNVASPWPERVQRIPAYLTPHTNFVWATNWVPGYTDWNAVISPTNYPGYIVRTFFDEVWPIYDGPLTATNVNWPYDLGYVTDCDTNWPIYKGPAPGTYVYYRSTNGLWGARQRSYFSGTNSSTLFINPAEPGGFDAPHITNSLVSVPYITATNVTHGGSLVSVSSNAACAIEIYPGRTGLLSWMKQGNPDVKWMCLLSNGIDFYRDPQSGEPMWFNVEVEWVEKIPKQGEWRQE
jgi:hypothetical protein